MIGCFSHHTPSPLTFHRILFPPMNLVSLTGHRSQSLLAALPAGPVWFRISCVQPARKWTSIDHLFWYLKCFIQFRKSILGHCCLG